MDITQLRQMLGLGGYDELGFGAPDKTGWSTVEVTDVRTGDFRVVGQYKGGHFRPAGESQATRLVPARLRTTPVYYQPPPLSPFVTMQALVFVFGSLGGLIGLFVTQGYLFHMGHQIDVSLEWGIGTACWLWFSGRAFLKLGELAARGSSAEKGTRPLATMPTDRFTMASIDCPKCGGQVSDWECPYCSWVRDDVTPREDASVGPSGPPPGEQTQTVVSHSSGTATPLSVAGPDMVKSPRGPLIKTQKGNAKLIGVLVGVLVIGFVVVGIIGVVTGDGDSTANTANASGASSNLGVTRGGFAWQGDNTVIVVGFVDGRVAAKAMR